MGDFSESDRINIFDRAAAGKAWSPLNFPLTIY
jgi:hypothetical protein